MSWLSGILTRARLLTRVGAETRVDEEIRFHIEMESDRLKREGVDADEARRRALVAFGGIDKTKEAMRAGRGLAWLSGLHLDIKLGMRMVAKYPLLTFASVIALAIAITLAASWFQFSNNLVAPRLPLPEPNRLVIVHNVDLESGSPERKSLHEYGLWVQQITLVKDFTATVNTRYNVVTADGKLAAIEGVRTTASLFRVARIQPAIGRALNDSDDDPGAHSVAVIGYAAAQRIFGSPQTALGKIVRLGAQPTLIVGVMPKGFGLPFNAEMWTPLPESMLTYPSRVGPPMMMFGRLAGDATRDQAQAELTAVSKRTAEQSATRDRMRVNVQRYAPGANMGLLVSAFNVPLFLFLCVVSANVATLLFARTASRESEIALRTALGGSRRRIILQLSAEAFVLTFSAAVLALAAAHFGFRRAMDLFWEVQQEAPPFWWHSGLSISSTIYIASLAMIGAVIIGALPGLRATRRDLRQRLAQPGSGGSGMKFGGIATGVIVVQVALCVAFIPLAILAGREALAGQRSSELSAEGFLTGQLSVEATPSSSFAQNTEHTNAMFEEVHRRLAAEPGVVVVTRSSRLPGFNHPMENIVLNGDSSAAYHIRQVGIDANFFTTIGARIVRGRAFADNDARNDNAVAIVDETWAKKTFGAKDPIGRRFRYSQRAGDEGTKWYEVVGVVSGADRVTGPGTEVAVFHPLVLRAAPAVQFYIRTNGLASALAPQVQTIVEGTDANLTLSRLMPLSEEWRPVERGNVALIAGIGVVGATILLFAMIGIYALMAFTVAQREKEIGIRIALGANPRRIILAIFRRAAIQIGLGIAVGATLIGLAVFDEPGGMQIVALVALGMLVIGMMGSLLPAARALRVQPIEALRAE